MRNGERFGLSSPGLAGVAAAAAFVDRLSIFGGAGVSAAAPPSAGTDTLLGLMAAAGRMTADAVVRALDLAAGENKRASEYSGTVGAPGALGKEPLPGEEAVLPGCCSVGRARLATTGT